MSDIDKIKAEIERLKKENHSGTQEWIDAKECAYNAVLSFIDTLKDESIPNLELIQQSWYREGYLDRDNGMEPMWITTTGKGCPKTEKNPKYGQKLQESDNITDWEKKAKRFENFSDLAERQAKKFSADNSGYDKDTFYMAFIHGWQRCMKQVMKEAVDAHIAESFNPVSDKSGCYLHGFTCTYELKANTPYVVAGDKVKLIILKDDV